MDAYRKSLFLPVVPPAETMIDSSETTTTIAEPLDSSTPALQVA
jgi:hypothetical protein